MSEGEKVCNICGGTAFADMRARVGVRCTQCGSLERTRVLMLHLQRLGVPREGQRVLHFAPEGGLADWLRGVVGDPNYEAYDLRPERYGSGTERFDLCRQIHELPSARYDLILHNHVLEHLPCNYSAVLFHLHRALTADGLHVCCVPFSEGYYEEQGGALGSAERKKRFGQEDHVRRFGAADVADTLGMIVRLLPEYDLTRLFPREALQRANIPEYARHGYSPHSVLVLRKEDLLLR